MPAYADVRSALSSLLSFALLMPSIFLLVTIAIHRIRVARSVSRVQRYFKSHSADKEKRIEHRHCLFCLCRNASGLQISPGRKTPPRTNRLLSHLRQQASFLLRHPSHPPKSPLLQPSPSITPWTPRPHLSRLHARSQPSLSERKIEQSLHRLSGTSQRTNARSAWSNFEKGEVVRILPCGHVFHKAECDEWLMKWRKLVRPWGLVSVILALMISVRLVERT